MLSKIRIKFIHSLKLKKFRDVHRLFIAEGIKIVSELLDSNIKVKELYVVKDFFKQKSNIQQYEVTEAELKKISFLSTPNKVIAVAEIPKHDIGKENFSSMLSIVLDDIQDPGNLGTIVRIADWFGIENIICSNNSVDVYNPKVVQATMGSIAHVKVHYTDLREFFKSQKNTQSIKTYGAVLNGENIYKRELSDKGLIVLGNESNGISDKLLPYITDKISIPTFAANKSQSAESLNVSIAAAIICSEFRKIKL